MQASILRFLHRIATPFLDLLANGASFFGEETFVIAIVLLVFWNINKQKGFALYMNVLTSVLIMGILKAVVRAPRPFVVLEEIAGKRMETATGYSFPSGHTTTAASFYTSIALLLKKRICSIIAAIMIVLVGVSRLYLGVHWPNDVFAGLLIGVSISFLLYRWSLQLFEDRVRLVRFSIRYGLIATFVSLILSVLLNMELVDPVAFNDLMKTLALAGAGLLGFGFEEQIVRYRVEASLTKKILRYLLGMGVVIAIIASKALFPPSIYAISSFIRYSLVGIWATVLFPITGKSLHLFDDER
ncbi:MAG TPA: phosphatase PAP2 family protein [Sphaerochaeta sp.]|jgi:membrane-associated phospholipid phosphatase|nr:phosphatase PAP2 family protein [Sphaerochaeta sp.]HPY44394.1 phosphatase PAP2 family protein [Sphaerochaeta sp.]HQB05452.1 phosphatase PAP2 family protein [Sphaerochaeta sp.]